MILYHSAVTVKNEWMAQHPTGIYILVSYASKTLDGQTPEWCRGVFLDSGAFSVWNSGASIDLDKYIHFLRLHGEEYDAYAGLDIIGDWRGTLRNCKKMRLAGLHPLPTFHKGEPFEALEEMCREYRHIAVGGAAMLPKACRRQFFDKAWAVIQKYPDTKVHGFGMTDFTLARAYPWYSVDSTTACRAARTGVLISPWGQLRVSSGITSFSSATIHTPSKIEGVMEWVHSIVPKEMRFTWEEISEPSTAGTGKRTLLNLLIMEHLFQHGTGQWKPTQKARGFGI